MPGAGVAVGRSGPDERDVQPSASPLSEHLELLTAEVDCLSLLARGMAHELGNLEMMANELAFEVKERAEAGSELREHLNEFTRFLSHCGDLARQLKSFASSDGMGAIDLVALTRDCEPLLRLGLAPGVELELNLPPGPCRVAGERAQLQLALLRLVCGLGRARPGSRRVRIRLDAIGRLPGLVALRISDANGTGEPDARRENGARASVEDHVAADLAVVQTIVRRHGGRLELDPTGHGGTTATLTLPGLAPEV